MLNLQIKAFIQGTGRVTGLECDPLNIRGELAQTMLDNGSATRYLKQ